MMFGENLPGVVLIIMFRVSVCGDVIITLACDIYHNEKSEDALTRLAIWYLLPTCRHCTY